MANFVIDHVLDRYADIITERLRAARLNPFSIIASSTAQDRMLKLNLTKYDHRIDEKLVGKKYDPCYKEPTPASKDSMCFDNTKFISRRRAPKIHEPPAMTEESSGER